MRAFNLFTNYPKPKGVRYVGSNLRTIDHRIIASYRDKRLYDGNRNCGYGGFKYDGRWKEIALKICREYNLNNNSSLLQLGCEKGFLLNDLKNLYPNMRIQGLDISEYAINNSMESVKKNVKKCDGYLKLEFGEKEFDFVIAIGPVYAPNLTDAIQCLKEIQRTSKGKSFVTLGSYKTKKDYWLYKQWLILGTTILHEKEWIKVLNHVNYTGDYYFSNAKTLHLKQK